MKYIILFVLVVIVVVSSLAQPKHDHVWKTGYGLNASKYLNCTTIDFNTNPLQLRADSIRMTTSAANAALSDKNGKFICNTAGYWLEDEDAEIVKGSKNLACLQDSTLIKYLNKTGNFGGFQCVLMLPTPTKEEEEFHVIGFSTDSLGDYVDDITAARVDYRNGKIEVVEKCKLATSGKSFHSAFLTACKHGNGVDWWILAIESNYKTAHLLLLTKDGIVQDNVVPMNAVIDNYVASGFGCFTNNGRKLAIYTIANGLWLYDFNRCKGTLDNFQSIPIKGEAVDIVHNSGLGLAISSNNRFLYVSKTLYLYQFDLESKDIASSKVLIAEMPEKLDTFWDAGFNNLQLAPNDKIYMSNMGGRKYFHAIENPNEKGKSCNFKPKSLILPTNTAFGLPNYPNFRLGAVPNGNCDSIIEPPDTTFAIIVYPNPYYSGEDLTIKYDGSASTDFVLFDITGRLLYRKLLLQTKEKQSIQLPPFPAGNYIYKIGAYAGKLQILVN